MARRIRPRRAARALRGCNRPGRHKPPSRRRRSTCRPARCRGPRQRACRNVASTKVPRLTIRPLALQLTVDLLNHLVDQPLARQLIAKMPQRRMIGRAVRKAEAGKAAERQPVTNLRLKYWIAQPMPHAQQETARLRFRRIADVARAGTAALTEQASDRHPVQFLRYQVEDRLIRRRKNRPPGSVDQALDRPSRILLAGYPHGTTDPILCKDLTRREGRAPRPAWNKGRSNFAPQCPRCSGNQGGNMRWIAEEAIAYARDVLGIPVYK